jgi:hypothetical protein
MSSSSEGIGRFDCIICYELAYDRPHTCNEENCCKLLCGKCAIREKFKCPNCFKNQSIKPAEPAFKKVIGREKVFCKCGKKVRMENMEIHLMKYCEANEAPIVEAQEETGVTVE